MKYKHFSIEEREKLQELFWQKTSIRFIAKELRRSPSSVSRELKRNFPPSHKVYTPRLAQKRAEYKRTQRGREETPALRRYVIKMLKNGWSPEQIAGKAKEEAGTSVSHEAIYQFVYSRVNLYGKVRGEDLRPYLARRRKRRMKKGMRKPWKIRQEGLPSIEIRPPEVTERKEVGHWEDDSIVYTPSCPVRLRTTNDLASGLVLISKTTDASMAEANRISKERLGELPKECLKTLTRDRGSENMGYKELEKELDISCFFAHPYSSWERGANENLNGLIRRFFPKGTDFRKVSDQQIQRVEYLLNSRPRKRFGWKTPYEVFYKLTGVALQS
jgi:IS30 family transposase